MAAGWRLTERSYAAQASTSRRRADAARGAVAASTRTGKTSGEWCNVSANTAAPADCAARGRVPGPHMRSASAPASRDDGELQVRKQPVPHSMPVATCRGPQGQRPCLNVRGHERCEGQLLTDESAQLAFLRARAASGAERVARKQCELMEQQIAADSEAELCNELAAAVRKHEGHLHQHEQESWNNEEHCRELHNALRRQRAEINARASQLRLAQESACRSKEELEKSQSHECAALLRVETEELESQLVKQEAQIEELKFGAEAEAMAVRRVQREQDEEKRTVATLEAEAAAGAAQLNQEAIEVEELRSQIVSRPPHNCCTSSESGRIADELLRCEAELAEGEAQSAMHWTHFEAVSAEVERLQGRVERRDRLIRRLHRERQRFDNYELAVRECEQRLEALSQTCITGRRDVHALSDGCGGGGGRRRWDGRGSCANLREACDDAIFCLDGSCRDLGYGGTGRGSSGPRAHHGTDVLLSASMFDAATRAVQADLQDLVSRATCIGDDAAPIGAPAAVLLRHLSSSLLGTMEAPRGRGNARGGDAGAALSGEARFRK